MCYICSLPASLESVKVRLGQFEMLYLPAQSEPQACWPHSNQQPPSCLRPNPDERAGRSDAGCSPAASGEEEPRTSPSGPASSGGPLAAGCAGQPRARQPRPGHGPRRRGLQRPRGQWNPPRNRLGGADQSSRLRNRFPDSRTPAGKQNKKVKLLIICLLNFHFKLMII